MVKDFGCSCTWQCTSICNSSSRNLTPTSGLCQNGGHICYANIRAGEVLLHIKMRKRFGIFIYDLLMGYVYDYINLCVSHVCIACRGPERPSDSMNLQLLIVMSHQMLVQRYEP